jgi:DNA-binding transcriptional regulator YiaG
MTTRTSTDPNELAAFVSEVKAAQLPPAADRRRIREAAGLTFRDIARFLDVNPMTVIRWEEGNTPRRAHAIRYRQLLDALEEATS